MNCCENTLDKCETPCRWLIITVILLIMVIFTSGALYLTTNNGTDVFSRENNPHQQRYDLPENMRDKPDPELRAL